jgi:uncharacterized protein (DUF433 family)
MKTEKKIQIVPKVGEGIYSTRDVAFILQLPYYKVSRWMREFWDNYTFGIEGNKAVNFYTLIEFYTFYHLRENGISAQKIKIIHARISKDLNTPYPFARKIHTDKKDIWYEHLENLIKADNKKQFDLKPLLIPFLNKVEFNKDEIADRYYPLANSKRVVVDPRLQFGQPTITGTGIKVEIINGFYQGGESKETICNLYNLQIDQVEDAILYFKRSA